MEPIKPLPVKVTISESLDGDLSEEEILGGQRIRTIIDSSDLTVASFGKDFVLQKPDLLYSIVSNSQAIEGDVFDALVKFGDGKSDLFVKIRSSTSSSSKKKPELVPIALSLFLEEGGELAMLYPNDNLYKVIQGYNFTAGPPHLQICPSKQWEDKSDEELFDSSSMTSISLIVKDGELLQIQDGTLSTTEPPKSPRKRKKKDPNAPKSKKTAYTFYLREQHQVLKESDPDITFQDISKTVSQQWKYLDEEGKSNYVAMAKKDKTRYEEEAGKYVPPTYEEDEEDHLHDKKKRKKDPNAPKGARNVYWYFCRETRPKLIDANGGKTLAFQDFNAKLGKRYKELSEEEKIKFQRMAENDRERYESEMKLYNGGKFVASEDKVDKEGNDTEENHEEAKSDEEEEGGTSTKKPEGEEENKTPSKAKARRSKKASSSASVKSSSKKKKKGSRRRSSSRRKAKE